jgi:hypothetical protein
MTQSNNIIAFNQSIRLQNVTDNVDADVVLNRAIGKTVDVLIIGTTPDGLQYIDYSNSDAKNIVWLLECAKASVMAQVFYGDDDDE